MHKKYVLHVGDILNFSCHVPQNRLRLPSQLLASLGVEDRLDVAPSAAWLSAAPAALLWEAPGAALRRQGTSVKLTAWLTPPGEVDPRRIID